jgi:hypothetical protein
MATVALGGTGVVVSGREACRKRFGTDSQYLRHLADDFLPQIIERVLFAADACQGTYLPSSRVSSMEGFSFSELKERASYRGFAARLDRSNRHLDSLAHLPVLRVGNADLVIQNISAHKGDLGLLSPVR